MAGHSKAQALRTLQTRAAGFSAIGFILLWTAFSTRPAFLAAGSYRWPAAASAAWLYFSIVLLRECDTNRTGEGPLFSSLGPANLLTLSRALLMSAFTGFLLVRREAVALPWLPGALYLAAALPDFVDGIVARRTGRATRLGEILDLNVDSIGVFSSSTLAVLYGIVPGWYLPIGLARYLFVFGLRVRERLGLPVHDLPPSLRRRGFAALMMGFMFVVLFPVFRPPATHLAAAAFGLPFAVGFLWDFGLAAGWIRSGAGGRDSAVVQALVGWAPVFLRVLAVVLMGVTAGRHLGLPETAGIALLEFGAALLIGLGVAVHSAAMGAAALLGLAQNSVPLGQAGSLLVFVLVGLIFLGGGRFSLLPIEDRLIHHRIGDPA